MNMDFYSALGLEAPAEGGNEQEVAEPATEGGNEQEVAEPAQVSEEAEEAEAQTGEEEQEEDAEDADAPPTAQTKEERAANARRRRQQEQEAAIRQAEAAAEARVKAHYDKIIAEAGLTNPLKDRTPVTQISDLEEYVRNKNQRQIEKDLKDGKLTPEALAAVVEQSEPYKAMKAMVDKANGEREQQMISAQMDAIAKLDPSIKEPKDFLSMPDYAEFKGYVDKGCSYVEAFKLTRYEQLISTTAAKQAQASAAKAAGKGHLTASRSKGRGAESVPTDVMAMYQLLNPGVSEADIQAHYNKNLH